MNVRTKIPNIETNYYEYIRPMIEEYGAIDMAQGYTGFHCSPRLIELVGKHLSEGLNQLSPCEGEYILRDRLSKKIHSLYGRIYNPETEITITSGSAQAIYTAISSFVKEGEEVLIFEPANINYAAAVEMCAAQPVFVPMKSPDFHIDWEEAQKLVSTKTSMLIINTPHAPTGWSMSEIDMLRLQRLVNGTKIIILSEETFEHIVFDGEVHQSMSQYPVLAERSICVFSFGETYHITGWQMGYCVAPAELMQKFRKVHQVILYSVNSPFQLALADFLTEEDEYRKLNSFYQHKRNLFTSFFEDSKYKLVPSKGTFFQLIDFSSVSNVTDREFALSLIENHGVASVPLSIFCHERSKKQIVRVNFAKPDEVLKEAASRLLKV